MGPCQLQLTSDHNKPSPYASHPLIPAFGTLELSETHEPDTQ